MARSYFLPDYQGAGLERRIQETDKQNNITTCSTYGLYNSIQSGMTCSVVYPASGLTCYTCACDSVYKYSSADCPTPPYILSDQCKGKYKSCSCDTTLYPTTSATGGCQYGFIPDINNYCEDKPDGTKHYACVKPVCKPDNITVEDCQAQGDGHNCTASKEANCTDYCDSNGCQDNCAYLTQTGQARSDCQYGCAVGKEVSGCPDLCYECGDAPESPTNTCADIYDGKSNTTAIISQLGADALAATAANQYYVGDKNGAFGQGQWYLPSIGELVDMYGVDSSKITYGSGTSGATGGYLKEINDLLTILHEEAGIDTDILSDSYWSSSEHSADHVWTLTVSSANGSGNRSYALKDYSDHTYVRAFLQVKSCFNTSGGTIPGIGWLMYADKTCGHLYDYDGSKQVVGIVSAVGNDGSVKIVSLKNLTFSSIDSSGNFDADNPYGGKYEESVWAPYDKREVNVTAVPNYSSDKLKTMLKTCATKEKPICPYPDAAAAIFDGKSNTKAAVNQLGNKALAAYATTQFYVGDKNGAFGQGQWYLPAIGELMDFYGTDVSSMTAGNGTSGAVGDNKAKINAALTTLGGKGADAKALTNNYYWSSSERHDLYSWRLNLSSGNRDYYNKVYTGYVRPCQLLENCFNPATNSTPKIGDVMYVDKTWGSAEDYDGSKQAVGIVSAVGNDGSVKIISLKDLTFSSQGSVGNFNPDHPYGGTEKYTQWKIMNLLGDVDDIISYDSEELLTAFKRCRE